MSDELGDKRKDRMDKLELLQELFNIMHRNCLEPIDELLKGAIQARFTGKLELLIMHEVRSRRQKVNMSLRLCALHEPERHDAVYYPIDPQTLVDMYKRLDPEPAPPEHTVTVFDASKPSESA